MEAMLYELLEDNKVQCNLCNYRCVINNGKRGICGVRENQNGKLIALNYNLAISSSIDPIEKKPIFEYLPNTKTYSFATVGCNMDCPWCQNFSISQAPKPAKEVVGFKTLPEEHVALALKYNCPSLSYTYSEPTIFFEYALETMKIASKKGLKNIWVSNGYMTEEALRLILPYLDAANIDYKGTKLAYAKYCKSDNLRVLENLKLMQENNVHLEVTTLIIPGVNDKIKQIKEIANDLINYLGKDFIWHLTRFFPYYKMKNKYPTPKKTLYKAKDLANDLGIHKIYLGNI